MVLNATTVMAHQPQWKLDALVLCYQVRAITTSQLLHWPGSVMHLPTSQYR